MFQFFFTLCRWCCLVILLASAVSSRLAWAEDSPAIPLIAEGAELQTVAEGFSFLEGPAAAPGGDLFFVDLRQNKILRWHVKEEKLSTLTEESFAANGMQMDAQGRLLACQGGKRRIVAFDPATGKVAEVLADRFEGKQFNNPNDLWLDPKGGVYFTDPAYSRKKEELELDGKHVFYISPDRKSVKQVTSDYHTPNGIVGTADGKTLYITDRRLGRTWRYAIQEDGTLEDKELVGADGITLDEQGNLYTTPQANKLRVFSPDGKELPAIELPRPASNVCFAGEDGKTLFITTAPALFSLQMTVTGQ